MPSSNGIKRIQLEFDNYGWNIPLAKRVIDDIENEFINLINHMN